MSTALLDPIARSDWNPAAARHLLSRAGFGVPHSFVADLAGLSPEAAVDRLILGEESAPPLGDPDFLMEPEEFRLLRAEYALLSDEERKMKAQELRRQEREAVTRLQAWWIQRMITTACPLQEKMALFWHGHFATSAQKVRSSYHNYTLNDTFRRYATGNFKTLTVAVGQSPAMLRYLDNAQSTKKQPNENWARELMELFTIGKGHYTENDIKESARAFTGWGLAEEQFRFQEKVHDFGMKSFMGRQGDFDGWDIIDIIFEQPATAEFICGKLWKFFAYENPEQDVVRGLADTMRASGYELKPVLRQLFLSQAFHGPQARGTQIKSPAQFAIGLVADLGVADPPYPRMARATDQLGQNLFFPPNVKGWGGNRAWINANTLLIRYNMPVELAAQLGKRRPAPEQAMTDMSMMAQPQEVPPPPWKPESLLDGMDFTTVGAAVEALERRFLAVPLREEQRCILAKALCASDDLAAPLRPADVTRSNLLPALHLLLSSAEYQLC
jgi:hypothetical protein